MTQSYRIYVRAHSKLNGIKSQPVLAVGPVVALWLSLM